MLVLARKLNEKIMIGEDIEITIVGISGDSVRLGIDAPRTVKILRSEVYEEIERQNKEAAKENTTSDLNVLQQALTQKLSGKKQKTDNN